jgi:hypothetical protein
MIAAGLSWRMAIGACVLGNTLMGLVITMNGRIGATVRVTTGVQAKDADEDKATHTLPNPSSYAFRILLQLLRRCVTLCVGHHLAWVSGFGNIILSPITLTGFIVCRQ